MKRRPLLQASLAASLLGLSGAVRAAAQCDVIVVGGGGAGLSAAAAAAEAGLRVVLLEKQPAVGGNTLRSGGFFAAVDPKRQSLLGISDSIDKFRDQILENGSGRSDPELAAVLAEGAGDMLAYLEAGGMRFKDDIIEIYGAHWARCHLPTLPNGEGYVRTLLSLAKKHGAEIVTGAKAVRLLQDGSGRVSGVAYRRNGVELLCRASRGVILASGGFGANPEMIGRFAPRLAGLTTDNTVGSTGEMLLEAERLGAELIDMNEVQCLPGRPPGGRRRVRLHNDVSRFIFVDRQGRRFVREDARRDVFRDAVLALSEKTAFSVVDDWGLRSYDILVQKETVLGVETGDAWRDPLGKSPDELRHKLVKPPFWACYAAMTVHYTMGGVRINARAEVLDGRGRPIPGLWAAGEVTGGIHGRNRMGANGINDALVFGRIAGRRAAGLDAR